MGGDTRIAWGTYPWSILRHLFLRGPVTGTVAIFTFMACLKIESVIHNVMYWRGYFTTETQTAITQGGLFNIYKYKK